MKVVAIVGAEGVGKTHLIKFLCQKYNTSFVKEFGSWYCKNVLKGYYDGTTFLTKKQDFQIIINTQKKLHQQALQTNKKVIFFDTDLIYTKYFIDAQFPNWNILNQQLSTQPIDYYFFLLPQNIIKKENSLIKHSTFKKENERLLSLYQANVNDKLIIINGDYQSVQEQVINLLQKIL